MSSIAAAPASFLGLPGELRNRIYELVLLETEPIAARVVHDRRQRLFAALLPAGEPIHGRQQKRTVGLFQANKIIHAEASALFYSQNCFDFSNAIPEDVASFLARVGNNNASHIRHVLIEFPWFQYLDPGDISLEDRSIRALASIQSCCANLSTLTTCLYSTHAMELRLDNLDNPKVATEALKLVDTRLRNGASLQEIVLEVYENGPCDYIRSKMESHGWTLRTTENIEENWDSVSNFGYDEYGGGPDSYADNDDDYGFDNGDDYDIDNDSDFWRRAAD